jgi:hypothetical protein
VIGDVESIIIKRINDSNPIEARVDTGAGYCSIHGENVEEVDGFIKFTYDGVRYKVPVQRKIGILSADGGRVERSIVKFNVSFKGNDYNDVEFTVADRGHLKYDVLIGRNLLKDADVMINI